MTHNELVQRAIKWLYSYGCSFACGEVVSLNPTGEIPDAIGWKSNQSILIECKTSRADFHADKKKYFRQHPEQGMGSLRFFMCEEGIIKPEDLPPKWGLLIIKGKRIKREVFPKGNVLSNMRDFHFERNIEAENILLVSCLRKL